MRLTVLKTKLRLFALPRPNPQVSAAVTALSPGHRPLWQMALTRPLQWNKDVPRGPLATLEQGFFFPASQPWVIQKCMFKRFNLAAAHDPLGPEGRQVALRWELLAGVTELTDHTSAPCRPSDSFNHVPANNIYTGLRLLRPAVGGATPSTRPRGLAGFGDPAKAAGSPRSFSFLSSAAPLSAPMNEAPGVAEGRHSWSRQRFAKLMNPLASTTLAGLSPTSLPPSGAPGRQKHNGALRPLQQVRYKPGLSKAWRLLRLQFCLAWALPWLRQRRFTNYVTQLTRVTGLGFLRMCAYSLGSLMRGSGLLPLTSGLVQTCAFVNGARVNNPFFQIHRGDRVGLVAARPWPTPRWQNVMAQLQTPVPHGCEVDGLTRSFTLWGAITPAELAQLSFLRPLPFLTFRMYNWKYRH